jgi:peptidase M23-like protein
VRHPIAIAAIATAWCLFLGAPARGDEDCPGNGRLFSGWFLSGKAESLWVRFSPEMKVAAHGMDGLEGLMKQVSEQAGRQAEILNETCESKGPVRIYTRLSRFDRRPGSITMRWAWDANGVIVVGSVRPTAAPAPSAFLDYQTKTKLRLPFQGSWYVFWGGRTLETNYHVIAPDQRFAYDFIQMKNGVSHRGDGKTNEQYYCFGLPILAPGPGTVAAVADSLPDMNPGSRDPVHPFGNHVVIDHGDGEFSVLAHLRHGSVRVAPGQILAAGDTLGACGNSGNTSEPHLHYHLQNGQALGAAQGLPAYFIAYSADTTPVSRGEPRKGQIVTPK